MFGTQKSLRTISVRQPLRFFSTQRPSESHPTGQPLRFFSALHAVRILLNKVAAGDSQHHSPSESFPKLQAFKSSSGFESAPQNPSQYCSTSESFSTQQPLTKRPSESISPAILLLLLKMATLKILFKIKALRNLTWQPIRILLNVGATQNSHQHSSG